MKRAALILLLLIGSAHAQQIMHGAGTDYPGGAKTDQWERFGKYLVWINPPNRTGNAFHTVIIINIPDDPNVVRLDPTPFSGPPESIMYGIIGTCITDPRLYQMTGALSFSGKDGGGVPLGDLMPNGVETVAHKVPPGSPLVKAFAVLCK
jgi:hypothetical protein